MSKRFKSTAEHFAFGGVITDLELRPSLTDETAIRDELFGDKFDPEKMIDAYEQQHGIKPIAEQKPNQILYKSIMLSPGSDDDDGKLLFQLMNDKQLYPMLKEDHYWTPRGEYKMFVIYGEDQKVKELRASEAALAEASKLQ